MNKRLGTYLATILFACTLSACGGGGGDATTTPPQNRAPVAQNVAVDTNQEESISGQLAATDADGDALSFQLVNTSSTPHKGTLDLTNTSTGDFTYVPDIGEFGEDAFTFRVNDGQSNSNDATLTVRINAEPQVSDLTIVTVANELVSDTVQISDPDAGPLTTSIETQAQNGVATITDTETGAFDYQPNADYVGQDEFTVLVTDGAATSMSGTVTIDVAQRPVIAFTLPSSIGNESQIEQIEISADPASPLDSTVGIMVDGTATIGIDFTAPTVPVVIPAGSTAVNLQLSVLDDGDLEVGETADLLLVAPCSACDISSTDFNHVVTLDDWQGTVQLASDSASGIMIEALADDATSGPIVGGTGGGVFAGISLQSEEGFLAKFDLEGNLAWLTPILPQLPAGRQNAGPLEITVAPDGSIFAVGRTGIIGESASAFVIKLSSDGLVYWSTIYGGIDADVASRIALDSLGNIYIAGRTTNSLGGPSAGSSDLFIAQFDPTGTHNWTRQTGSTVSDGTPEVGLAVSSSGNAVVASTVYGTVDGIPIFGSSAVIILSFDTSGAELWRTFLDTPSSELATEAVALPGGGVMIAGNASSELQAGKIRGPYIAKVSDAGNIDWISQQTDTEGTQIYDLAVDATGNVFATGVTLGDWTGDGNYGNLDILVMGFDSVGSLAWTQQFGGVSTEYSGGIGLDGRGNTFVGGFGGDMDMLGLIRPSSGRQSVLVKLGSDGAIH